MIHKTDNLHAESVNEAELELTGLQAKVRMIEEEFQKERAVYHEKINSKKVKDKQRFHDNFKSAIEKFVKSLEKTMGENRYALLDNVFVKVQMAVAGLRDDLNKHQSEIFRAKNSDSILKRLDSIEKNINDSQSEINEKLHAAPVKKISEEIADNVGAVIVSTSDETTQEPNQNDVSASDQQSDQTPQFEFSDDDAIVMMGDEKVDQPAPIVPPNDALAADQEFDQAPQLELPDDEVISLDDEDVTDIIPSPKKPEKEAPKPVANVIPNDLKIRRNEYNERERVLLDLLPPRLKAVYHKVRDGESKSHIMIEDRELPQLEQRFQDALKEKQGIEGRISQFIAKIAAESDINSASQHHYLISILDRGIDVIKKLKTEHEKENLPAGRNSTVPASLAPARAAVPSTPTAPVAPSAPVAASATPPVVPPAPPSPPATPSSTPPGSPSPHNSANKGKSPTAAPYAPISFSATKEGARAKLTTFLNNNSVGGLWGLMMAGAMGGRDKMLKEAGVSAAPAAEKAVKQVDTVAGDAKKDIGKAVAGAQKPAEAAKKEVEKTADKKKEEVKKPA
jgi:hypothetical protein